MTKTLGSKRIAFLLVVVLAASGFGYLYSEVLVDMHQKSTQELQSTKSAVDQKYNEVTKLKEEYVLLRSQLRSYKELEARGFFNDQERTAAFDKLDKLSKFAGLLKANLKISKGDLIEDAMATQAGQVVLKSPVEVEIKSLDDVDVYSFIKFIEEKFPGRVDIASLSLERIEIFDTTILRKIGAGDPTPLVNSKLQFDWITMAPKDVVAPQGNSSEGVAK